MKETPEVVYGIHAVEGLLGQRLETVDHVYFDRTKKSPALFNLIKTCRKERLAYNLVPPLKVTRIAGTDRHQGVAAICSVKPYCSPETLNAALAGNPAPFLVVAASIEDPQNLGALIRSCVAFGVDALLLERKNTAPLSPAVARVSAGTVEYCAIVRPKNLEGIIRGYGESGFTIAGAAVAHGVPPEEIDWTGPLILVLGGEHRGIPPYLERLCTRFVSIPIDKKAHSLNVAAAGAVIMYERVRQKKTTGS